MGFTRDPPDRLDLSFRSNDDAVVSLTWVEGCPPVGVPCSAATVSFAFDQARQTYQDGVPLPRPDPDVHVITTAAAVGDPGGWIDPQPLRYGEILVAVPHTVWDAYTMRTGTWDGLAVATTGMQRCVSRGLFIVEAGVSSPISPEPVAST